MEELRRERDLESQRADLAESEAERLRKRESVLVDALTDCKTVLCESRRGEDMKTLTDEELGRLWTSLETKVDAALSTAADTAEKANER